MNKNLTAHFYERWVERILGMGSDKATLKEYINTNRDKIAEHANTTFEYAEFVWKGQLGDNITRNFYIKDDMVFVTTTDDTAFITVYKVDLGFTPELNTHVRKGLMKEIEKLRIAKDEAEFEIELQVDVKKNEINQMDDMIRVMEEQIANLKTRRKMLESEVKSLQVQSINTGLELKKYALTLVNSQEYKKDIVGAK